MSEPEIIKIKIAIVGQHAVGKTSLIKQCVEDKFSMDYLPTIGTNLFIKKMAFKSGNRDYMVTLTLFDIAGQKRWQGMRAAYYKGSNGVMLVCDLTKKQTIDKIENFWIGDIRKHVNSPNLILVCNKNDLPSGIDDMEIQDLCGRLGISKFIRTSAKTGEHVDACFSEIIRQCITHKEAIEVKEISPIPIK